MIELCGLRPAIFEREADLGNDAFDRDPEPGNSCDEPRRCEDVLECDKTESESSLEVPEENSVDNLLALLFRGAAMMGSKFEDGTTKSSVCDSSYNCSPLGMERV